MQNHHEILGISNAGSPYGGHSLVWLALMALLLACQTSAPQFTTYPKKLKPADGSDVRAVSGIVKDWMLPEQYRPFSPRTIVEYYVVDSAYVRIVLRGTEPAVVDVLVDQWQAPGLYEAALHPASIQAWGPFYYEFRVDSAIENVPTRISYPGWAEGVLRVASGVRGNVWGVSGSAMPPYPSLDTHAIIDANVQLRKFYGKDKPAGEVVASTLTDSLGNYMLRAPSGTYFLVLRSAKEIGLKTTGFRRKNFDWSENVNHFEIITLPADTVLEINLQAATVVPS